MELYSHMPITSDADIEQLITGVIHYVETALTLIQAQKDLGLIDLDLFL